MFEESTDPFADEDIRTLCKAIHAVYLSYVSNPFVGVNPGDLPTKNPDAIVLQPCTSPSADPLNTQITSPRVHQRIMTILGW